MAFGVNASMNRRDWMLVALAAALPAIAGAQAAAPDPLAALDADRQRVVKDHLKSLARPGEGDAQASDIVVADLDGDGNAEGVLWWTFYGPTFSYSGLTVFAGTPRWRVAAQNRLTGNVDRLTVERGVIRVEAKTLGPNDPRCCPSKPVVERWRWSAGKLVKA
jgi:hypothetical protein